MSPVMPSDWFGPTTSAMLPDDNDDLYYGDEPGTADGEFDDL